MSSSSNLSTLCSDAGKERRRLNATHVEAKEAATAAVLLQEQEEERNFRPFRFIDLPPELQKMVYRLYDANIEDKYKPQRPLRTKRHDSSPKRQLANLPIPALAHVCHEIRTGFLETLLEEGDFIIVIGPYVPAPLKFGPFWNPPWTSEALLNRMKKATDRNDPLLLGQHMSGLLKTSMAFGM